MSGKNVLLSITGRRGEFELSEKIELVTQGVLYDAPNGVTLEYEESELSGMDGTITRIHLNGGHVEMERTGSSQSYFIFHEGKKFFGSYQTPLGNVEMGMFPLRVDYQLDEHGGKVDLQYLLELGQSRSMNHLLLSFRVNH